MRKSIRRSSSPASCSRYSWRNRLENTFSHQLEHAPLPVTRFNQAFEFSLRITPVEELVNQGPVNLPGAILPHPHFFELAQAQKQTHPLYVRFVTLGRIGIDQPIVP